MNKLKKVGLSALAGSLVAATSAYAGEIAVSGSAKLTYTDKEQGSGATGTPFGMNKLLGFSGSAFLPLQTPNFLLYSVIL